MANYPERQWGGVESSLTGELSHWGVADYDIAEVVAALIGAFWGVYVRVV